MREHCRHRHRADLIHPTTKPTKPSVQSNHPPTHPPTHSPTLQYLCLFLQRVRCTQPMQVNTRPNNVGIFFRQISHTVHKNDIFSCGFITVKRSMRNACPHPLRGKRSLVNSDVSYSCLLSTQTHTHASFCTICQCVPRVQTRTVC